MIVRELFARLGFQVDGRSVMAADRRIGVFRQSLGNLATQSERTFGTLSRTLAGFAALFSAQRLLGGLVRTTFETEQFMSILVTLEGSVEAATARFEQLEEFAARTPFSIQQNTSAWIRFRGAGLVPTTETLENLGNVAATFQTDIDNLVEGIQAAARGSPLILQNILRTSIDSQTEQGKVLFQVAGESFRAERSFQGLLDVIEQIGATRFAGAMERQANTMIGAASNLGDAWDTFQRRIGIGSGLNLVLRDLFRNLTFMLEGSDAVADAIGQRLVRAVVAANNALIWLFDHLDDILGVLRVIGTAALSAGIMRLSVALVGMATAALNPVRLLNLALLAIPLLIDDILGFMEGGRDSVIGRLLGGDESERAERFRAALRQLAGPLLDIVKGVVSAAMQLGMLVGDLAGKVLGLAEGIPVVDLLGASFAAMAALIERIVEGIETIREFFEWRERRSINIRTGLEASQADLTTEQGRETLQRLSAERARAGLGPTLRQRQLDLMATGVDPAIAGVVQFLPFGFRGQRTVGLHIEQSLNFAGTTATPEQIGNAAQRAVEQGAQEVLDREERAAGSRGQF